MIGHKVTYTTLRLELKFEPFRQQIGIVLAMMKCEVFDSEINNRLYLCIKSLALVICCM